MINAKTRRLAVDLRTAALDSVLRAPVPRVMELGKQQANDLAPAVSGKEAANSGDSSTDELVRWSRQNR